jgi:hypothetical protein
MEQVLEFLERRPAWFRGLVWYVIETFMTEDDRGLEEEQASRPSIKQVWQEN